MREKMTLVDPGATLIRLLDALADELIEASDEEILQAAKELGMKPQMKGSAAFAGITYSVKPKLADFYDLQQETNLPMALKWWSHLTKDADE